MSILGQMLSKKGGIMQLVYANQSPLLKMGVGSISFKIYDVPH